MTLVAFATGLSLVLILGMIHHVGVLTIVRVAPNFRASGHAPIMITFTCLLILHSFEILSFALVLAALLEINGFGDLGGTFSGTWEGLIYFSGMSFVTLGFSDIKALGPIRLVAMFFSLGGFMVLTWSATLLYSICSKIWQQDS
ncbi:hypothetical protein FP2506_00090 [Fulvimarina pelagi HTCC2506]|uniref:Potassium channel domain-containing protein n=1 Tax=Fulvimarina pelagi HTCC2506 TaxID=314231 RepID=Q0FXW7_9HYPH|nr:ion channel [Fulvimarina pelagi]EAU39766.1 hypothetical protein FP2506_00090 [Fulvimarina pelagi HTCC2506]